MRKKIRSTTLLMLVASFLSGLLTILDFFGALSPVQWLSDRLHALPVLLFGLTLALSALILEKLDNVESLLRAGVLERLSSLQEQLDSSLKIVFGDEISNLCTSLKQAIEDRKIQITTSMFPYYYRRTLDAFPRATFLATSLPYQRFFWKNPELENAIHSFIENGGKFQRIFFTDEDTDDSDEVTDILNTQCRIGVTVYTINSREADGLMKLFLIDENERIAWEPYINTNKQIISVTATSDAETIHHYKQLFLQLRALPQTKRYHSARQT
jgi:hypothetical protein